MLKQKRLTRLSWTQARCTFRRKGRRRKLVIVRNICSDLFWKVSFLKKSKKDNPGGSTFSFKLFSTDRNLIEKELPTKCLLKNWQSFWELLLCQCTVQMVLTSFQSNILKVSNEVMIWEIEDNLCSSVWNNLSSN